MDIDEAKLIEPTEALNSELLAMAEEYRAGGDERFREVLEDFSGYMRQVSFYAAGVNLPPDHVRSDTFFLARGETIIGRSALRHQLTPALEHEGGHIGYDIRPSARRRGYGTFILALTLEKARSLGLERALLTCDTDNIASARIIEKNGGALAGRVVSQRSGRLISQYWIELSS